jgi:hypothetical protein
VGRYGRLDLLLLDELGYVQLDPRGAELLFQIITEREERASIAIATTCRSANGPQCSPTPASSPRSSTASPPTPTSSKPAPVLAARHQQDHDAAQAQPEFAGPSKRATSASATATHDATSTNSGASRTS